MNILAFDTSSSVLCATLVCDASSTSGETRTFDVSIQDGLRHAEVLIAAIDSLYSNAGVSKASTGLIVCGKGPGSFTGLRIGMATAKGLVQALGCPLVTVSALDAMAWRKKCWPGLVVPLIDARKNRFYAGLYLDGNRLGGDGYFDLACADLKSHITRFVEPSIQAFPILATGPDAVLFSTRLSEDPANVTPQWTLITDSSCTEGFGRALAALGALKAERNEWEALDAVPEYVRSSDAEIGISQRNPAASAI